MKAIVQSKYGGPATLSLVEMDKPEPKEDEILIKVDATAITAAGVFMREGKPYVGRLFTGLFQPKKKILGTDFAGEIVDLGAQVKNYKLGDRVMGSTDLDMGCYVEYKIIKADDLFTSIPPKISSEEATGIIDGGCTALAFLREAVKIKKGDRVLVYGASGSIGVAAVQIAQYLGAEVSGVCSLKNKSLVSDLGAAEVLSYEKENWEKDLFQYDVIFDAVGKWSYTKAKKHLKQEGSYLTPVLTCSVFFHSLFLTPFTSKKLKFMATGMRSKERRLKDLIFIRDMMIWNRIETIIDKIYSPHQIQKAHEYVDTGKKRGNVIMKMG